VSSSSATRQLDVSIASDTAIYPTCDEQQRLFLPAEKSPEQTAIIRLWKKFKTGQ